jgi:hypothetical protein
MRKTMQRLLKIMCPSVRHIVKQLFLLSIYGFSIFYCSALTEGAEFSLSPSIALRQAYDDNIYLTKGNRKDDYIARILPSFNLQYKSESWDLSSDYTLEWWYYWKLKEGGDSHNLNLTSQIRVINNLFYIDVSDTYSSVVLNPRRPSTETNLQVNRSDSNNAILSPYLKFQITPLLFLSSGYRYTNSWYRESTGVNRQTHTGFASLEYKVNPKLNIAFSAEYTYDSPDENSFNEANHEATAFLRAQYTLTPLTDLDASVGYRRITFAQDQEDNMLLYTLLVTHRFKGTGRIEFRADSTSKATPELGIVRSNSEELNLLIGENLIVNARFFHRIDQYLEIDREDTAFGFITGIEYRPQPRLTYEISARYERGKYLPEDQKRDIYGVSGEIAYMLTNKATVSLSYNYTEDNGDIEIHDYRNNIAAVQVNVAY